ncbi:hypothetical protein BLNAU_1146 [Blattamonas nauphoetae]|uniref:Uncharacterized protein n=1 Tax=Blattamonas nauphoetae TaxID=2049346 RepID=A0ABQ9YJX3_9EUKA|nr:hypothetical protein BLNAU_1146 [Blattamonas nauphoetae]
MPVALTIPSGLTFFGRDDSIWDSLAQMIDTQFKWNKQSGNIRQMGLTVHRMLRMEDIEDAIETKLLNDTISRVGVQRFIFSDRTPSTVPLLQNRSCPSSPFLAVCVDVVAS